MSEPAQKPVVGDDGELLVADPHIDMAEYHEYVAERSLGQVAIERVQRQTNMRNFTLVTAAAGAVFILLLLLLARPSTPVQQYAPPPISEVIESHPADVPSSVSGLAPNMENWDARAILSNTTAFTVSEAHGALAIQWLPNSQQWFTRSRSNDLYLWNLSGTHEQVTQYMSVNAFAASPDGQSIFILAEGVQTLLLDILDYMPNRTATRVDLLGTENVFWSPDGRYIALQMSSGLKIMDATSMEIIQAFPYSSPTYSLQWRPDSQALVWAAEGDIWEWQIAKESPRQLSAPEPNFHVDEIRLLSADFGWLVTDTSVGSSTKILQVTSDLERTWGQPVWMTGLVRLHVPLKEKWLLIETDRRISLYDITKWTEVIGQDIPDQETVNAIEWSTDGSYVIIGTSNSLLMWSLAYILS